MAGGSIDALVAHGDPRRQHLDLGVIDGADTRGRNRASRPAAGTSSRTCPRTASSPRARGSERDGRCRRSVRRLRRAAGPRAPRLPVPASASSRDRAWPPPDAGGSALPGAPPAGRARPGRLPGRTCRRRWRSPRRSAGLDIGFVIEPARHRPPIPGLGQATRVGDDAMNRLDRCLRQIGRRGMSAHDRAPATAPPCAPGRARNCGHRAPRARSSRDPARSTRHRARRAPRHADSRAACNSCRMVKIYVADAVPSRPYTRRRGKSRRAALDTDHHLRRVVSEHPHDDAAEDSRPAERRWRELRPLPLRRATGAGRPRLPGLGHRPARCPRSRWPSSAW